MGVKISVICFNCGAKNEVDIEPILTSGKIPIFFVCQECGALNEVDVDPQNLNDREQDWLCLPPKGFEWVLPSGKIVPIIGDPIYVSAFGEYLSRNAYLKKYKVDPEIAYEYMRKKRNPPTSSTGTNRVSQCVKASRMLDLSNIEKIEVVCNNCGDICELDL
jgi:transcription elongation factor Elf1